MWYVRYKLTNGVERTLLIEGTQFPADVFEELNLGMDLMSLEMNWVMETRKVDQDE